MTETESIINQIKEITGEPEEVIVNNAVEIFLKKHLMPIVSLASILGCGVFHHTLHFVNL